MKRPWLLPLTSLYAAGVAWQNRRWNTHPERAKQLADPLISVGSLSAGGAGKTPFVIALAEALRRAGYGIDVLTRGHGRTSDADLRVQSNGTAAEFGDEPLLLAQRLACPVYVARERYRAGQMAERDRRVLRADRHLSMHLLDDGFQHRPLARAVDIALFTLEDAQDTLLPAGNLREPRRALRRADVVVLRSDEAAALQLHLERIFQGHAMPELWQIGRRYAVVQGHVTARPLAFCGIARPESFRASLQALGVQPADFIALRDHQRYTPAVLRRLKQTASASAADGFITTAKDAVKLTDSMRRELAGVGPLVVCDVSVELHNEAACVASILARIEAGWKRRLQP